MSRLNALRQREWAGTLLCVLWFALQSTAHERDVLERLPTPVEPVSDELTLDQLERIALANNPTLRQAAAQVTAVRGKWLQVGLKPNPRRGYFADEIGPGGAAESIEK